MRYEKISLFILLPDDNPQKRTQKTKSASCQSKWKRLRDHPCWLHLPEGDRDCVCTSLIDALTLVTGMMCFPRKTPPQVWSTVWSHEQVRAAYVCVCVYAYVCDGQCSANFRRCLRSRTAVWRIWLITGSIDPSVWTFSTWRLKNKEQIYLPARLPNLFRLFALEPFFFTSTLQAWNVLCANSTCVV